MTEEEKDLLRPVFWEIDINSLDPQEYKKYTIERILQYGTIDHVKWMLDNFSNTDIIEAVKVSKNIDRRTANYWALYYGINKEEITCFSTHYVRSNSLF